MAYDRALADRLRVTLANEPGLTEKAMFGGVGFMIGGHMAVAASSTGGLMVRVDPARTPELLAEPGVSPVVMRGRSMNGWLDVVAEAVADDASLRRWAQAGVAYIQSLPPKR